MYLHPSEAETFFVDYDQSARNAAAILRMEMGRNPHDEELVAFVGQLSTCSELFRQQWASQDVRVHGHGSRRVNHPVVGELDLGFESMDLPTDPGLQLNVYTARAGGSAADNLACWRRVASKGRLATELHAPGG